MFHHFSIFHARNFWPDYVVGSDPYDFADVILMQLDTGQIYSRCLHFSPMYGHVWWEMNGNDITEPYWTIILSSQFKIAPVLQTDHHDAQDRPVYRGRFGRHPALRRWS